MAKKSDIKISKVPSTIVLKKKKATSKNTEIIKKLKAISTKYTDIKKCYVNMLTKCGEKGGSLPADDEWYKPITNVKKSAEKRSGYMINRVNDLNSLFHQDIGDEAQYLAQRVAELEKTVQKLQSQSVTDTDVS